jgi:hypothetical protein
MKKFFLRFIRFIPFTRHYAQLLAESEKRSESYRCAWIDTANQLARADARIALLQTELFRVRQAQVAYEMHVRRCST